MCVCPGWGGCLCACVCARARACVCACVCVRVCARGAAAIWRERLECTARAMARIEQLLSGMSCFEVEAFDAHQGLAAATVQRACAGAADKPLRACACCAALWALSSCGLGRGA
jgi:hypothetical protein